MKVVFESDVLEVERAWNHLDLIISTIAEGQHEWLIEDADVIENSPWITADAGGRAGRRNLEVLAKSYTSQAYPRTTKLHQKRVSVTLAPKQGDRQQLTPEHAWIALKAPAFVVVENAESDGGFIIAMMMAWKRADLLDAIQHGWLEFAHLGGVGEVAKVLRRLLRKTVGPIRVHVLSDSDQRYPGELTNTIRKVSASCTSEGVPYTVLRKRSIENYLPVELLPKRCNCNSIRYPVRGATGSLRHEARVSVWQARSVDCGMPSRVVQYSAAPPPAGPMRRLRRLRRDGISETGL